MAITSFAEPIFDADVRLVNFFNGRMLSAEDLSREQDANREERRRLGRAIGDGVAYGLEVTPTVGVDRATAPAVTISAGLAVNRRGQTLALASSVDLLLKQLPSATASTTSDIQTFAVCDPLDTNAYVAGAGAYLLTIGEAKGKQGLAPVSGLGNIQASCNTKYLVPGVRFRLIPLTLESTDLNEPDLLRNKLAYRCLAGGPQATDPPVDEGFFANLFGPPITEYGVIDRLRPHLPESALTGTWLKECEVPLALLYLTATNGLVFVDMWSVRRRIVAPSADSSFPLLTSDRRLAEGEAMFLQFQQQMLDLASALNNPQGTRAVDYFKYLPPVGVVPLASNRFPRGFHQDLFLDTITHRKPIPVIEGARVRVLVRMALDFPPLDLDSKVMVWVYQVRESRQAISQGPIVNAPQPYMIFATGHMAYLGDAHFNVNRWDFSNLAIE